MSLTLQWPDFESKFTFINKISETFIVRSWTWVTGNVMETRKNGNVKQASAIYIYIEVTLLQLS